MIDGNIIANSTGDPLDWSRIIGFTSSPTIPLGSQEIPEIGELHELVAETPELRKKLVLITSTLPDRQSAFVLQFSVVSFLTEIMNRAEALNTFDEESLLSIYCELEKSRFSEELEAELVVPLSLVRSDLLGTLQLGKNVRIEQISDGDQKSRKLPTSFLERVPVALTAAATHAIVVTPVIINNQQFADRQAVLEATEEGIDLTVVEKVLQAIHMISGKQVGYSQLCLRPKGWADSWTLDLPALTSVRTTRRFPAYFADQGWVGEGVSVNRTTFVELARVFPILDSAPANVSLAAGRCLSTIMRTEDQDIILDACIGIEALVGNGRDELTHRMAQRSAAALTMREQSFDPRTIYLGIKKVYEQRSAIVHGSAKPHKPIIFGTYTTTARELAPLLLRLLLLSWLDHQWTPDSLDDRLLQGLRPQETTTSLNGT